MAEDKSIEITLEMIEAGALEIEKYSSGEYDPFFVAEQVFLAMINHPGHQSSQ